LQAGDVILTGALGPMAAIRPGDVVEAQIGGLGRVGFSVGSESK
jgi:2-keto-4-pentenoate hydratase